MALPLLTPLPPPPLPTDPESVFDTKAGNTLVAQKDLVDELNASFIPTFNNMQEDMQNSLDTAMEYVQDAYTAANDAALERAECYGYKLEAEAASGIAVSARNDADGFAVSAESARDDAQGFASNASIAQVAAEDARDTAQYWAEQAQEIVEAGIIDDESLANNRVRSALDTSKGNFKSVEVDTDTSIGILEFAHIVEDSVGVTVTIPSTPEIGQMVMIGNFTNRVDHRVDVGLIPIKGQDAAGFLNIDRAFYTITLKYTSPTYGWEIL